MADSNSSLKEILGEEVKRLVEQNQSIIEKQTEKTSLDAEPQAVILADKAPLKLDIKAADTPPGPKPSFGKWLLQNFFKSKPGTAAVQSAPAPIKTVASPEPSIPAKKPLPSKPKTKLEEANELKEIEKMYLEGMSTIRDMIAPAAVEIKPGYMKISDTLARGFFVYSYPRFIEANWLSSLINLDTTIDISLFVYPTRSEDMLRVLRRKVAQMQSTMRMNAEKGRVRDPGLDVALQDAEELRDQLQRGEEKFFHLGLYLTLYADTEEKLEKMTTQVEAILGGKMVLTKRAYFQQENAFYSSLPLGLD
ncbi:MAG TPA: hypothetical protein PLQ36_02380, partial [Candidatus Gracilibacteria bacterium]|nr:hypothetical protein [Candidatus Gracilibacteria bacterium]